MRDSDDCEDADIFNGDPYARPPGFQEDPSVAAAPIRRGCCGFESSLV